MFVGGEFYYEDRWLMDKPVIATGQMTFLNGGKACLTLICDYLIDHQVDRILLPAYLCPTIVQTIDSAGLRFDFYQVNEDLSVNLEDLSHKIADYPAAYLINYFGFHHSAETSLFFKSLQEKGVIVVEDNAQAGFADQVFGDFVFNSLRKFCAYDGGYLFTRHEMAPYLEKYTGRTNRRLPIIRDYRKRLPAYLFKEDDDYDALEEEFYLAEHYYEVDQVVLGDGQEREAIERMDWPGIKRVRRENYTYLLNLVNSIPEIKPIFPALQADMMPLGMPVYLDGVSRDWVNEELSNHQIGLTIHWEEILDNPHTNRDPLSVNMARRMLTLPVDQRFDHRHMDYLAHHLRQAISAAKSLPMDK